MEISNEAEKMEMPFGELNVFRKDKSLCTGVLQKGDIARNLLDESIMYM